MDRNIKPSWKATIAALALLAVFGAPGSAAANPPDNASPTCSDVLAIDVHGQHVVADYVMGTGHGNMDWPPSDDNVGQTVGGNGGAAVPGGPGPGFHFDNGFAPGASFCTDSNSPGLHL